MFAHDITAVILAGGIGKRFIPFATDKTLFPFMGQSLLSRTLQMVADSGITQVIIATNSYNQDWCSENAQHFPTLNIRTVRQESPQGMGDAVLALRHMLPNEHVLFMNAGDMVAPRLLQELIASIGDQNVVLTGRETSQYQPLGYFELNEAGNIVGIQEKPGADHMPSTLSNLVFHYFADAQAFVGRIELAAQSATNDSDDVYEQALDALMKSEPVGVYRYSGPWQKLKFGYNALDMVEYFLNDADSFIDPSAEIASTAVIKGNVHIAAGAKIFEGAVIQGPCFIGENVIVGNQALVRSSIIEADSVIGFASEIVRSYIGPQCDLHHAYVGDSVLESKVHFGYNAHTANYRFDHQNVVLKTTLGSLETPKNKLGALIARGAEIGVNTSILPGICIGTNAIIYPASVVYQVIPDNSVVKGQRDQAIVSPENAV